MFTRRSFIGLASLIPFAGSLFGGEDNPPPAKVGLKTGVARQLTIVNLGEIPVDIFRNGEFHWVLPKYSIYESSHFTKDEFTARATGDCALKIIETTMEGKTKVSLCNAGTSSLFISRLVTMKEA